MLLVHVLQRNPRSQCFQKEFLGSVYWFGFCQITLKTPEHTYTHTCTHTLPFAQTACSTLPAVLLSGVKVAVLGRRRIGCSCGGHWGGVGGDGQGGAGFNPPTLHEWQQLVRDLCQDILSQSGHAQDLVPWPVDVVPERNKLDRRQKWLFSSLGVCRFLQHLRCC